VSTTAEPVELCCPACRVPLRVRGAEWHCDACGRRFPTVAGIPDLRLAGDRYLTLDEDRAKAERLAATPGGFADGVRAYWEMTPEVPSALAEQYLARALDGEPRAEPHLDRIGRVHGRLLDVGCGTAGLLVAAARRGLQPVGVDIALRWLVLAQRALREAGVEAPLFAADGALLPFTAGSFDIAVSIETLEHTEDQRGLLNACLRVARPGGRRYVVTANRWSIAPEPVSGLLGVGYLPRRLAPAYVRARRGTRYQHFRAVSHAELEAWCGLDAPVRVGPAVLPAAPPSASSTRRSAQHAYETLLDLPVGRTVLGWIGPYLEVTDTPEP
jgi:SAM-dependent methyltransferase